MTSGCRVLRAGMCAAALAVAIQCVPVEAVLPMAHYERAQAGAGYHLQIRVHAVGRPDADHGSCWVEGQIVRVLRNRTRHALGPGDPVVFAPNCRRPGASPQLGGVWPAWDRLEAATYVDGYFEPDGDLAAGRASVPARPLQLRVVAEIVRPIDRPGPERPAPAPPGPPWPHLGTPLRSPDATAEVVVRLDHVPDPRAPGGGLVVSTLVLRDAHGRERVVHRSRRHASALAAPDGSPRRANLSQFLAVAWSPDGRRVLLGERLGFQSSDVYEDLPFVLDVSAGRVAYVPLAGLQEAVRAHWRQRGQPLLDRDWELGAAGWEGSTTGRVLLRAQVLFEPDAVFLGWWTIEADGSGPRLLTEEEIRPVP